MAAGFSARQIEGFRDDCGGRMPANEVEFLHSVQTFIEDAIREGLGFVPLVKSLRQNVRGLNRHRIEVEEALRFDLDAALAAGDVSPLNADQLMALRQVNGGPMSENELEYLRDIQGIIDYAIRNDLGLALVVGVLVQDLAGLAGYSFDLDESRADGFRPRISGFAGSDADSVGAPEDAND